MRPRPPARDIREAVPENANIGDRIAEKRVFPAVNIDTLIVKIYNDQNGSTWATASQYVDLGELWVGKVADFNVANDIKTVWKDATLQRRSHNNQAWALQTQPFREVTAHVVPMTEAVAIGPNSAQDDYETVAYALSTSTCCVLIESYLIRGPLNGNSPTNGSPPSIFPSPTKPNTRPPARRCDVTACSSSPAGPRSCSASKKNFIVIPRKTSTSSGGTSSKNISS